MYACVHVKWRGRILWVVGVSGVMGSMLCIVGCRVE